MLLLRPPEITGQAPSIFLGGPIQGTWDWQTRATNLLSLGTNLTEPLVVANPRRDYLDGTFDYELQVDWETWHLSWANVILFWLAKETDHACDRAYAQTSRFELAEWVIKSSIHRGCDLDDGDPASKLAIGIEPGFTGERYIRHRLKNRHDLPIFSTLEDTCQHALELL